MSRKGWPLCFEVFAGNQADVNTLSRFVDIIQKRLHLSQVIFVADRGLMSKKNIGILDEKGFPYIIGVRMRRQKEVREDVLARPGRYQGVRENLNVKEVFVDSRRYIICVNPEEAEKDKVDREAILATLNERLRTNGPKALISNKGYKRFLKIEKDAVKIDRKKVEDDARFDGKFVLRTNTELSAGEVAQAYKSLWQVERAFRELKSTLDIRPVFHHNDDMVIGHVMGAFLALRLEIHLMKCLDDAGEKVPWHNLMHDLNDLHMIKVTCEGKDYLLRTDLVGHAYKAFRAVGVRPPSMVTPL